MEQIRQYEIIYTEAAAQDIEEKADYRFTHLAHTFRKCMLDFVLHRFGAGFTEMRPLPAIPSQNYMNVHNC